MESRSLARHRRGAGAIAAAEFGRWLLVVNVPNRHRPAHLTCQKVVASRRQRPALQSARLPHHAVAGSPHRPIPHNPKALQHNPRGVTNGPTKFNIWPMFKFTPANRRRTLDGRELLGQMQRIVSFDGGGSLRIRVKARQGPG